MANLTENTSVEDVRDKAVQYYEDTGTRTNIQDLLNILYYQNPVDVNGFIAGFFNGISTEKLISGISFDSSCIDAQLRPQTVVHVHHLKFNNPRILSSFPCWLSDAASEYGGLVQTTLTKFSEKLKGYCVWDLEDIDCAMMSVLTELKQPQSDRASISGRATLSVDKPRLSVEMPESVSFAPLPPAALDEDGVRLLMELRGCVSMAMAIGGAKTSQMDLYQFIWYAMEAGRVQHYPTLSWVAESGVEIEVEPVPEVSSSAQSPGPENPESSGSVGIKETKKKVMPSAEKLQKYVDATIPVKESERQEKPTPPKSGPKMDVSDKLPSESEPFCVKTEALEASLGYDETTWPQIRDRLPRVVIPLFSFGSPPSSHSSQFSHNAVIDSYGAIAHVETVYAVPTSAVAPLEYGFLVQKILQVFLSH